MDFSDLAERIGESGAARASVRGDTLDGKQVTAVKVGASAEAVTAYLDAKGSDLDAFRETFAGQAVKVSAKRGDRAASDTIIL